MTETALRSRGESVQGDVHCGWCREKAAVEVEGRSYCGTCFLWIAVRQTTSSTRFRGSLASNHFASASVSSR